MYYQLINLIIQQLFCEFVLCRRFGFLTELFGLIEWKTNLGPLKTDQNPELCMRGPTQSVFEFLDILRYLEVVI